MGYTHYADIPRDMNETIFKAFVKDVKTILATAPKGMICGAWGVKGTKPTINDKLVSFNGNEDDSHETCHIPLLKGGVGLKFTFCKTARKPYDKYVTATYLALKFHFPETKISGDGDSNGYREGLILFNDACNRKFKMPKME